MADRRISELGGAETTDLVNDNSFLHLVNPGRVSDADKNRKVLRTQLEPLLPIEVPFVLPPGIVLAPNAQFHITLNYKDLQGVGGNFRLRRVRTYRVGSPLRAFAAGSYANDGMWLSAEFSADDVWVGNHLILGFTGASSGQPFTVRLGFRNTTANSVTSTGLESAVFTLARVL